MNKWIKWSGIVVLGPVLCLAFATYVISDMARRKMTRTIAVEVTPVALFDDARHIARGRYLYNTRGCADCHAANGAGKEVFNTDGLHVVSANLTGGANSATSAYGSQDWVRTIRHGVKPNGQPVMIMPSEDYNRLTDDDLASLIAFVQQLPAVDGETALVRLPLETRLKYVLGEVRDAAEKIDHTLAPALPVPDAVSLAHGAYVANTCMSCHGPGLSGGSIAGAPQAWPPAANLTPGRGSAMARYQDPNVFMAMLRSGQRPDGSPVSAVMPFGSLKEMSNTDVRALHAYLLALPPKPAGQQ